MAEPTTDEHAERQRSAMLQNIRDSSEFMQDELKFYHFAPLETRLRGWYSAHELRWIADELDRLNIPAQEALDTYFRENPKPPAPMDGENPFL